MWDRPLLHAVVELDDGRLLHIINLHLRAPLAVPVEGQKTGAFSWKTTSGWAEGFYLASMKRSGQALETRLLIDKIFDREKDALIMVCGDFNADERETPTRILCGDIEDTGNGDLAKRMLVPLERALPQSRRYTVIHRGRKHMLDHMLVSRALLANFEKLDVQNEALGDELVAYTAIGNSPESYHAPIVAEFNFARSSAANTD
jgi:endonuclease/exonuclease/phosphatase family metal-dependent hydrolase